MLIRLQNSAKAMTRFMRRQDQVSNNLANANTVGYKKTRTFTEVLDEYEDKEGSPQSENRTRQWIDFSQGTLTKTDNPLNVALSGDGLFAVRTDEGEVRYTRAGRFQLDEDGVVRDSGGNTVLGESGSLRVPPNHEGPIEIARDGTVEVDGRSVGELRVVTFGNPGQLEHREGALFAAPDQAPAELEQPDVRQGFLEESNVEPVQQMTEMITQARHFESQQRWMRTTDDILTRATRQMGKF